jgi:glycosyltransferase involved in cell wall biosynthesis
MEGGFGSMIKYSIIIPAYNAGNTIKSCLSAVINQSISRDDYEVIVVDDGSTDGTVIMVKNFPVKYIWQPNRGPASARNHGAREATGKIILFTDSDCIPAYKWVEEMTKPFEKIDVVAVKGAYKTNQRSLIARLAQTEFEERFEMLKRSESIDMVDTYSAAFRRDIFWQAGGFDESFPVANNEDTDLSYKLSSAGYKMVFNPEAIVYHLRHPDTLLRYARQKFWRGYWRMVVYKRFPKKMVRDAYTPQSLKFQILFLFGIVPFIILSTLLEMGSYLAVLLFIAFLISTLPFSLSAMKRDFLAGLMSPFFLAARALSIGLGVLYFFYKQIGDTIKK